MQYNVDFEVCALIFMIVLYVNFVTVKRLSNTQTRAYNALLIVTIFDIALDIYSSILINNFTPETKGINVAVCTGFLLLQAFLPYIMMNYIVILADADYTSRKRNFYLIVSIPMVSLLIITIVNLFGPLTFYFDNKGYHHAVLHDLYYIFAGFYLLVGILYVMMFHKNVNIKQRIRIYMMAAVIVAVTVIQYYHPEYNLTGAGVAIGIFILYLTVENPAAYADAITDAMNRKAFFKHHEELRRMKKKSQIYVMALDNFKIINEVFGMEGGDELMRRLVISLQQSYPKGKIFRYNSDIFALILDHKNQLTTDEIDNIQNIIRDKIELNGLEVELSACICHISSKYDMQTSLELTKTIDYAITEVKSRGKGQKLEVSEQFFNDLKRHATIEQAMLAAIDTNFFEVHYQVIYDAHTNSFRSMEALARLNVPGYGYISPDEFIKIAEQNGMINKIGVLVLREVCKTIKEEKLRELGIEFVEVNLSVVQCMRENLRDEIVEVIEEFGIPADMINLEITESVAAYSENTLIQNMESLIEAGIDFSLDDYGSGYSNINYIALLPFKIIKIDKEFVWAGFRDEKMSRILRNTIETFKDIGFKVLAEGAESEEMAKALIDMGIDHIQGYYYSKPLSRANTVALLKKQRG